MIPAVGKSGPCTNFRISGSVAAGIIHQRDRSIDDLGQIVWRNIRRHADSDTVRAIHQEIGNTCGENVGFNFAFVVVGAEVDRLFIQVFQQSGRYLRKFGFGVTVGCGRITVDRSEVALSIPADSAGSTAVPGEPTRHTPQDCREDGIYPSLLRRSWRIYASLCWEQPHLLHGVENAAMHRFQSVANIGQRAPDDDRHRVVEIRPPHLFFDIDGYNVQRARVSSLAGRWRVNGSSGFCGSSGMEKGAPGFGLLAGRSK